jgi:hypothetical protein
MGTKWMLGDEIMRKYMIGALFGFILAFGISAHAEVVNMIGKVVDGTFNVKVGDKTLDTPAIVIEGTSYLPVRAFGDATGYDVGFDANLGITMTPKMYTPAPSPQKMQLNVQNVPHVIFLGNEYRLNSDPNYIEVDGNQYVSLVTFDKKIYRIGYENPFAVFKSDSQNDVRINVSGDYSSGVDGFQYNATSYVKLSAFGLKATVNGDTLTIDKQ